MKLVSWNVNGIRSILGKGFLDFLRQESPDIICLQETKASPEQVDLSLPQYEHKFWNSAEKKGYSGTAIFSKIKPLSVIYRQDIAEHDNEGRIIALEFPNFYLVNVYVPNSGRELARLDYRKKWDADYLKFLKKLEAKKPVITCGDFNVAHQAIDLAHPKENYNKTAGYMQVEIDGFQNFINAGFIDSFRHFNQEGKNYSYWSYMFHARQKNIGWRIDYFLLSSILKDQLKEAKIYPHIQGSDHCPVSVVV